MNCSYLTALYLVRACFVLFANRGGSRFRSIFGFRLSTFVSLCGPGSVLVKRA